MPYHTRPMHIQDMSAVVDFCMEAYQTGQVTTLLWPNAASNRAQLRAFWVRMLRSIYRARGVHSLVTVYRDPEATSPEDIAGVTFWHRAGPSSDPTVRAWQAKNSSLSDRLESILLSVEELYAKWTRADAPGADLELRRNMGTANNVCMAKWSELYPEYWHLEFVAVSPNHQRKGIAGKLIKWGTDLADAEGVPATLFATEAGQTLYERHGYTLVDIAKTQDGSMVFNPFMVYEPESLKSGMPRLSEMEDVQEFRKAYKGERFQRWNILSVGR